MAEETFNTSRADLKERSAKGGRARARRLTPAERSAIAREGAQARWALPQPALAGDDVHHLEIVTAESEEPVELTNLPEAKYKGVLRLMSLEIPCYVLSDGRRVIG